MANFREILSKLFTRNVVIKKLPGGRLKTIDVNKSQSVGSPTTYGTRAKWRNGRNFNFTSGYGSGFTNEEFEAIRKQMYVDYELMDTDSIISSALDISSDECLGSNTIIPLLDGRKLTIKELFQSKEENFWLYGLSDDGDFRPVQGEKVIFKGRKKCLKFILEDGTEIICTHDHKWVLPGSLEIKLAKDFIVGDSIYGLSTKLFGTELNFIKSNNHKIIQILETEDDVYDIVNVGTNHLFAIESLDGTKIYTHNCTTVSENGELLIIKTDDLKLKKILHNLFYDVLDIEFNLWSWIRTMLKYGDNFLYLQIVEEAGVVNVMPIHPSLMIREEGTIQDPAQVRFRYEGDQGFSYSTKNYFEQFEIAHFRMLGDTNFLPYGKSFIEGARKEYKRLLLMEDAMMISRIMRAPERRLFKIDVGNLAPEDVESHMEQITQEMKKVPYIDPVTGDYDLRYNVINSIEDYYMPVRGGDTGTSIETLTGLQNDGMKEDVEYFKNKMISALKIPKEYLGYAEEGGGEKSSLAQIDLRFARTIERIQKIFVSELYKIAIVHLYVQGFKNEDLLGFELYLTNPSMIYERQRLDILTAKVDLVKSIKEDNLFSDKYIYENIFGMSAMEWKADRDQLIESAKFKFRIKEMAEAGNDPEKSLRSYTTPWDLASLQVSSKNEIGNKGEIEKLYTPDGREENEGKPPQYASSFETKRDQDFGRDPVGRRENEKAPSLTAQENVQRIIKGLDKFSRKPKTVLFENVDILDENNLLDDEIIN